MSDESAVTAAQLMSTPVVAVTAEHSPAAAGMVTATDLVAAVARGSAPVAARSESCEHGDRG